MKYIAFPLFLNIEKVEVIEICLLEDRMSLLCIANTTVADDLVKQGDRASAAMVLT